MRCLILAGGLGTRLRPITFFVPKCMVSVHGKPILHYIIEDLQKHKFDIVLSLGYKADVIKNYCKEKKLLVEYVLEKQPLGTGGALKNAQEFLEKYQNFCVVNGDTIINVDIDKLKSFHKNKICTTIHARRYDSNEFVPNGVFFFSNKIFNFIRQSEIVSLDEVVKRVPFKKVNIEERFVDIGQHNDLKYAKRNLFLEKEKNAKTCFCQSSIEN